MKRQIRNSEDHNTCTLHAVSSAFVQTYSTISSETQHITAVVCDKFTFVVQNAQLQIQSIAVIERLPPHGSQHGGRLEANAARVADSSDSDRLTVS